MIHPDVVSTIHDQTRGITYRVLAYRPLSHAELVSAIRTFHGQKRKPKLKPGQTVTIVTIIGHDEPAA